MWTSRALLLSGLLTLHNDFHWTIFMEDGAGMAHNSSYSVAHFSGYFSCLPFNIQKICSKKKEMFQSPQLPFSLLHISKKTETLLCGPGAFTSCSHLLIPSSEGCSRSKLIVARIPNSISESFPLLLKNKDKQLENSLVNGTLSLFGSKFVKRKQFRYHLFLCKQIKEGLFSLNETCPNRQSSQTQTAFNLILKQSSERGTIVWPWRWGGCGSSSLFQWLALYRQCHTLNTKIITMKELTCPEQNPLLHMNVF